MPAVSHLVKVVSLVVADVHSSGRERSLLLSKTNTTPCAVHLGVCTMASQQSLCGRPTDKKDRSCDRPCVWVYLFRNALVCLLPCLQGLAPSCVKS